MIRVISDDELPHNETTRRFEGYLYGDVDVSFFLSNTLPGGGPSLHAHPYEEVFVVQDGDLTFTVGDDVIEATGGQVVVVPAGMPHKFVNSGVGEARHIDIHASRRITQTEWLEGQENGDVWRSLPGREVHHDGTSFYLPRLYRQGCHPHRRRQGHRCRQGPHAGKGQHEGQGKRAGQESDGRYDRGDLWGRGRGHWGRG